MSFGPANPLVERTAWLDARLASSRLPMPATVASLQRKAELQGNPIAALERFLRREEESEAGGKTGRDKMRFVGYVLELGYETARIITSDPYKLAQARRRRSAPGVVPDHD